MSEAKAFRDAFEFDEDTITAILAGGEWHPVKRERLAVNPDSDGWVTIDRPDGSTLYLRESAIDGVLSEYDKVAAPPPIPPSEGES